MSTSSAKKIVKQYAKALRQARFQYSAVYLFGSHATGKFHSWSDIDVAVISDRLKEDRDSDRLLLWKVRREIDTRIEPHGFSLTDFKDRLDPMVHEIRRTGIRID